MFLVNGVLKICSKYTGKHPCRSMISIKLLCSFIEIALRHGCSPVKLRHIFRTPFLKNTFGWLLLYIHEFCLLMIELFSVISWMTWFKKIRWESVGYSFRNTLFKIVFFQDVSINKNQWRIQIKLYFSKTSFTSLNFFKICYFNMLI